MATPDLFYKKVSSKNDILSRDEIEDASVPIIFIDKHAGKINILSEEEDSTGVTPNKPGKKIVNDRFISKNDD